MKNNEEKSVDGAFKNKIYSGTICAGCNESKL